MGIPRWGGKPGRWRDQGCRTREGRYPRVGWRRRGRGCGDPPRWWGLESDWGTLWPQASHNFPQTSLPSSAPFGRVPGIGRGRVPRVAASGPSMRQAWLSSCQAVGRGGGRRPREEPLPSTKCFECIIDELPRLGAPSTSKQLRETAKGDPRKAGTSPGRAGLGRSGEGAYLKEDPQLPWGDSEGRRDFWPLPREQCSSNVEVIPERV